MTRSTPGDVLDKLHTRHEREYSALVQVLGVQEAGADGAGPSAALTTQHRSSDRVRALRGRVVKETVQEVVVDMDLPVDVKLEMDKEQSGVGGEVSSVGKGGGEGEGKEKGKRGKGGGLDAKQKRKSKGTQSPNFFLNFLDDLPDNDPLDENIIAWEDDDDDDDFETHDVDESTKAMEVG
jgi:hypothetical protein